MADVEFKHDILIKPKAYDGSALLSSIAQVKEGWFPWKLFNKEGGASDRCGDALRLSINPVLHHFDQEIFSVVDQGLQDYLNQNKFLTIEKDDGYTLLKMKVGDSIPPHYEPKMLKGILLLTDGYEGGELVFPRQELTLKPEAGTLILFPGSFIFPHYVNPVLSGERVEILTWFQ